MSQRQRTTPNTDAFKRAVAENKYEDPLKEAIRCCEAWERECAALRERTDDALVELVERCGAVLVTANRYGDLTIPIYAIIPGADMAGVAVYQVTREKEHLREWVIHNGGLLNEWAREWVPGKKTLTAFIGDKLDHALGVKP